MPVEPVVYEDVPRFIRTITAEVNIPGTTEWVTVSGWDAPMLQARPNPDKGVLRLIRGAEPEPSPGMLTDLRINALFTEGRADEWYFGMGQWRRAHFGEVRP
jgi:hypothetical protein